MANTEPEYTLLLECIANAFEDVLKAKTGWGRIEVMSAFYKAWTIGMTEYAKKKGIRLD